jgi:Bacterial protein of unknown function (DUF937)
MPFDARGTGGELRIQLLGASTAPGTGNRSLAIESVLSEAQNGQAYANLARAFHLPPDKVEEAVNDMLRALIPDIAERMGSPRSLAALVELLGKSDYEKVLETPTLLGATHTQVLGSEALTVLAGRKESKRLVRHAAATAGVSEMISEYLAPALAALLVGALARTCRQDLEAIMGHAQGAGDPVSQADPTPPPQLPIVAGGVGFSGSTGGTASLATYGAPESQYIDLAEDIRKQTPKGSEIADAVRHALAPILGLPPGSASLMRRIGEWGTSALTAITSPRR